MDTLVMKLKAAKRDFSFIPFGKIIHEKEDSVEKFLLTKTFLSFQWKMCYSVLL